MPGSKRNWEPLFWGIALALGTLSGWVHIAAPDPTLAALAVLAVSIGFGLGVGTKPWLWALLVGACVPAAELYMRLAGANLQRGSIQGSFAIGLIPAFVGTYSGFVMRRVVKVLMEKS